MVADLDLPHRQGSTRIVVDPGAVALLPRLAGELAPGHRLVALVDANVDRLHPDILAGIERVVVPAGEEHKSRTTWAALTDRLLELGCDRRTLIVAVGGGVTTDLAGFVAATFLRGVPWIAVPTTTLAMCDAAVGGKTGVDTESGKNLVGAFHQPLAVIADTTLLATLPDETFRDGLAEAVKHGAIADAEHFVWLEAALPTILERQPRALAELVAASVQIKATVVGEDEREASIRAILNAGHTVGHAIEHASGFAISHGRAVAIGLVEEAALGERMKVTAAGTAERLRALLARIGLDPAVPAELDRERYRRALSHDKKNRDGAIRAVLLRTIGAVARHPDGGWTWVLEEER